LCGILGYIGNQKSEHMSSEFVEALSTLQHRGPDDNGVSPIEYSGKSGLFGQTRLSIIDLSTNGHQPYKSKDDRFTLVFNGEIYNYLELKEELFSLGYSFESNSDTEVLLKAWIHWGEQSLKKFIGMFSFAIFDQELGTVVCARDPFGIKPLFFKVNQNSIFFASELTAFRRFFGSTLRIDRESAFSFLAKGVYDRSESTFVSGVSQLKPGHLLSINLNSKIFEAVVSRWWVPDLLDTTRLSFDQAALELRDLFLHSVKLHMRSDVRIASALSGGVDSSAILCAIRNLEPDADIHSFSYISDELISSEEKWVDMVNTHVRAIPHKIRISRSEMFEDLDKLILTQGEPFGSTSIYAQYKVFQSANANGIKVVLDGQGADEIFAGYHGYQNSRVDTFISQKKYASLVSFLFYWSQYPGRPKSQTFQYALSRVLPQNAVKILAQLRNQLNVPPWLNPQVTHIDFSGNEIRQLSEVYESEVTRQLLRDLVSTSLPALLRHADRNSMRWSVESRVPFLTPEIVNFSLSLPESYLISNRGETKSVLRAALRGLVPNEVLFRKDKIGFQTPELNLLRNSQILDELKSYDFESNDLLNKEFTVKFATDFIEGRNNDTRGFWRLYNFIRWTQLLGMKA
jgi:asparagine synthase (glutamine-hydrolysing)